MVIPRYRGKGKSAVVPYYADYTNYQVAYVNPYTGEPLYNRHLDESFFRWVLMGHYQLWLPRWIGKPIVAYGTLIFVIMLISGLVLWWPKKWSKRHLKKAFKISWSSSWRRINLDLHNVVGFYMIIVALILALTGMVYGMSWFKKAVYWTASGGELPKRERVTSDTTLVASHSILDEDRLYSNLIQSGLNFESAEVWFNYPRGEKGVWTVQVNPNPNNTYLQRSTYYEQHTLKKLKQEPVFANANLAEQLMRINYDLHVGSIGGIWTKIIAFLVCIFCASLPITGFIFWYDRERRKHKRDKKKRSKLKNAEKKRQEQTKRIPRDPVSV